MARRSGALTTSGAWAAVGIGTIAALPGAAWAVLLVSYFVSSSVLSRVGQRAKAARVAGVLEKEGARDARQVLANGGVFALAALVATIAMGTARADLAQLGACAGIGALAASAADTWATEIGTWLGGTPRSVRTWRPVPVGTSGGMSVAGTAGMLAGGLAIGSIGVFLLSSTRGGAAALIALCTIAGVAGALADTALGAWVQSRRRCPVCDDATEQRVHRCGTPTVPAGGWAWLDNDVVNGACTMVGACVAITGAVVLSFGMAF
ncbi:MAG: DUF92 domain-containing protein [Gemmatimonadaceae bacterium]|nr:DUF92 domain-containing protein [Gemmatimonadaceae bacterium]